MSLDLICLAIILAAVSGLPGLCLPRSSSGGHRVAVAMMVVASALGLCGVWAGFGAAPSHPRAFPWPAAGNSVVGVDALSAFFLVPIFLMGGLGSVYSLGYWPQAQNPETGRKLRLFWGLLVSGLGLLVIGRHAMAFLLGWEVMALSGFFLVSAEDDKAECRRAGWVYFIATHVSTLALFAWIAVWRWSTGSYDLRPVPAEAIELGVLNILFFLALIGFGLKAGVMPLHFWLPGAHANAPSHVSAMLSGVVIKMGIYGMLRVLSLLPEPPAAWGGLILALGAVSALLGVVFALGQHDLKQLLAYHSVENIGIILMGLGLALLGRTAHRPEWIVLGLAGCLLHVWNHSLFKSLLFFCAGSVVHSARTRRIDELGGLARTMPWTAAMFLTGAVAICGLPPLNGFVSELLVYLGLLGSSPASLIAVPILAMTGALAVACFVKVFGAVFLGSPRRANGGAHGSTELTAHESPASMIAPMAVLAAFCALIGLMPPLVIPVLDAVIASWPPEGFASAPSIGALAPLKFVSAAALALTGLIAASAAILSLCAARRPETARAVTWDCGYAAPAARMQYTASSFAQMIVHLFRWVLRPVVSRGPVQGLFPASAHLHTHVDDAVLDRMLIPSAHRVARGFGWFHQFQHGLTQHYVFYMLMTLILMLSTLLPIRELCARLLAR